MKIYKALVEDDEADKNLGRVRVRILGIHDFNNKEPVDTLPLAYVMQSTAFRGGINANGSTAIPQKGSWVYVFFENDDYRVPVIIGYVKTINDNQKIKNNNAPMVTGSELDKTSLEVKKSKQIKGITGNSNTHNELPENTSSNIYPNTTAIICPSGSFIELDNSNGSRIHIFHTKGSYYEIKNNGTIIYKSVSDNQKFIDKNDLEVIRANKSKIVYGNESNKINSNQTIKIGGNKDVKIGGSYTKNVGGIYKITASTIFLN